MVDTEHQDIETECADEQTDNHHDANHHTQKPRCLSGIEFVILGLIILALKEFGDVLVRGILDFENHTRRLVVNTSIGRMMIRIENSGDTKFLPGSLVDVLDFEDENERLTALDKQPAEGKQIILGITKAALATSSFLSAASFQETTKVLTDAAIHGRIDPLIGLKENVILGKLIPAGTGMKRYRSTRLSTDARLRRIGEAAAEAAQEADEKSN